MSLFILFLLILIPLAEIYLFVELGDLLGGGVTLLWILATGIFGVSLMRRQGVATLTRARQEISRGLPPGSLLAHGLLVFLGGFLLMVPGFLTDALGVLLLLPPVRAVLLMIAIDMVLSSLTGGLSDFMPSGEMQNHNDSEKPQSKTGKSGKATSHKMQKKSGTVIDADHQVIDENDTPR